MALDLTCFDCHSVTQSMDHGCPMDVSADPSSNIINIDDDHVMSCWVGGCLGLEWDVRRQH